jgi:bilirubin oxidase
MSKSRRWRLAAWGWLGLAFLIAPEPPTATGREASLARPLQDLRVPPLVEGTSFDLTLGRSSRSFWPGATTATYSYNNTGFWGPTLVFHRGETVRVRVKNDLAEPTTVHWHGLHLPASADGGPHQLIPPGATWSPSWKVDNNAGTYWYHPHPHETTQKQLTAGAGGLILIKDPVEAALPLPRSYGVDDLPLVLTSRRFLQDDQFSFEGDNDKYGDYLLANGTLDARVKLPAQVVRLRVLNAEIERGYNLGFADGRTFHLIATDGGLIERPLPLTRLRLMVGERAEILVDLGQDQPGSALDLMAFNANQPFGFPGGEPGTDRPNGSLLNDLDFRVLRVEVTPATPGAITAIPAALVKDTPLAEADVTNRRTVRITGGQPGTAFTFDDKAYAGHANNHVVQLGAVEEWTVVNNNVFGHTFHIHDVQFRINKRSRGGVADFERGWKDSVFIPRGQSVSFLARFDDFASETDPFMYHCHMANHEDGGLMGQFLVVKDPKAVALSSVNFRDRREHPLTPEIAVETEKRAGTVAPAFQVADLEGRPLALASLTKETPVVLFFIEAACPCSRDASPYIDRLRATYGEACRFVGVIDAPPEVARAWAAKVGAGYPIVADPDQTLIRAYGADRSGSASVTLVAPGGRVEAAYPGYGSAMLAELNGSIARLGGVAPRPIELAGAPAQLVSGCPFPTR